MIATSRTRSTFPMEPVRTPPAFRISQAVTVPDCTGNRREGVIMRRQRGRCVNLHESGAGVKAVVEYEGKSYTRDRYGCYMVRIPERNAQALVVFAHETEIRNAE